jgi:hypothetical protein
VGSSYFSNKICIYFLRPPAGQLVVSNFRYVLHSKEVQTFHISPYPPLLIDVHGLQRSEVRVSVGRCKSDGKQFRGRGALTYNFSSTNTKDWVKRSLSRKNAVLPNLSVRICGAGPMAQA